jgi:hypothetical protein
VDTTRAIQNHIYASSFPGPSNLAPASNPVPTCDAGTQTEDTFTQMVTWVENLIKQSASLAQFNNTPIATHNVPARVATEENTGLFPSAHMYLSPEYNPPLLGQPVNTHSTYAPAAYDFPPLNQVSFRPTAVNTQFLPDPVGCDIPTVHTPAETHAFSTAATFQSSTFQQWQECRTSTQREPPPCKGITGHSRRRFSPEEVAVLFADSTVKSMLEIGKIKPYHLNLALSSPALKGLAAKHPVRNLRWRIETEIKKRRQNGYYGNPV